MYYKKRLGMSHQLQREDENQNRDQECAACDQFCFVHRMADLPLISASIKQILYFYERAKKSNRLLGASLHLTENSMKFAAGKAEPIRMFFDAPIVATNKLACQQLDKLEERYPVILISPEDFLRNGRSYYEQSFVKSGVETVYSVVVYGEKKVQLAKKLANDMFSGILYIGDMKFSDMFRLGVTTIDRTLAYSESLVNAYIAPPNYEQNGPLRDTNFSVISRLLHMSMKVAYGLQYKAYSGFETAKERALQIIGQMNIALRLIEYVNNTSHWLTDDALSKFSAVQSQAANILREMKDNTAKYGRKPDKLLLKMVQNASVTFVSLADLVNKYSASFLPHIVNTNVQLAVQYAHELSDTFNQATTLGELKTDVIKEAREKFTFVQAVFFSVMDRVAIYPPISWLVSFSVNRGILKQNFSDGEVTDGSERTPNKSKTQ